MFCPKCGTATEGSDRFCNRCGEGLGGLERSQHVAPTARRWGRKRTIAAGFAVLVAAGTAAGVYAWMFLAFYTFQAASLVPGDSYLFGTFTARPGLWQALNAAPAVEAFTSQPGFDAAVRGWQDRMQSYDGRRIDFDREILPLVDGEVAVALFGPLADTTPSFIWLARSNDPQKLLRTLTTYLRQPEATRGYKGAFVSVGGTTRSGGVENAYNVAAAHKEWVLFGSSRAAVEQAIDRLEGNTKGSLAEQERYRTIIDRLPRGKLGFAYLNSSPLLTQATRYSGWPSPEVRDAAEPLYGRAALSAMLSSDGLELNWESMPNRPPRAPRESVRGDALKAFDRLPADTFAALGADNMPAVFSSLEDGLNATLRQSLGSQAPRLSVQFGRWLGGEFAVGVTRGSLTRDKSRGYSYVDGQPDALLIAKVRDTATAKADLDALDTLLNPRPASVSGMAMKQLVPTPTFPINYGVADDWLYLTGGRADKVLPDPNATGLQSNPRYGLVRQVIANEGIGLFVDGEGVRTLVDQFLDQSQRRDYDLLVHPFAVPLKALGGNVRVDNNGDAHGRMVVAVRKS